MPGFYEQQLVVLTSFCLLSLLIDRHVTRRKANKAADDSLEQGIPANSESKSLATLTRQYLVVYGVVMGEFSNPSAEDARLICDRGGLAPRTIRVLVVSRAIWFS